MARARNIKPGFFENEMLAECDMATRLLFAGLWTLADREGRLEDRPVRIKMRIFPADAVDVGPMLEALALRGFIKRYVVGQMRCIQILTFAAHQTPHATEKDSEIPDEQGMLKVHERYKDKRITGAWSLVDSGLTVTQLSDKPLNPDSLNPDYLIADSLNPDSPNRVGKPTPHAQDADPPSDAAPVATQAGAVCVCLRSLGIQGVHPHRPELVELLGKGATVGNFEDAANTAKESGKPTFAYVAGIVRRRMLDAATIAGQAMSSVQRNDKRGGQQAISQTVTNADQAKRLIGLNP